MSSGARVGFVGLGRMGRPMARRLLEAGHDVLAYDTDAGARQAFGRCVDGLRAAADADIVILMLPGSAAVEEVLAELLDAMRPGATIVDMSSSEPWRTRELAEEAEAAGLRMLDAPVSGGVAGAEAGTLTIMAGGDPDLVAEHTPLLSVLGERVVHVGPAGAGHALKALNNLLSATHLLASAEALAIGREFGLDPEVMLTAINGSTGRSWSTEHKLPRFVLTETYASGFAFSLMLKDIRIAVRLGEEVGVPARLGSAAHAAWEDAAPTLAETADHTEIARWAAQSTVGGETR